MLTACCQTLYVLCDFHACTSQINIPVEMADSIIQEFTAGIVDRGMFHDAEIYVFCTLINYWKK